MPNNAALLAWFGVIVVGASRSQAMAGGDSGVAPPIEAVVKTVEGNVVHGRLVRLSLHDGALIRVAGGENRLVPFRDLVRITTDAAVSPPARREATITLIGGDRLFGRITGTGDESIVVETVDLGELAISLDSIMRIDTALASTPHYRRSAEWFANARSSNRRKMLIPHAGSTSPSTEDRILLINGDVVDGFITSITAEGVAIESPSGETVVPRRLIVSVRFALRSSAPLDQPAMLLTLRNSGRLTVTELDWSDNIITARLRTGPRVRFDSERIVSVEALGGRWEWLSIRRPISYQHTPMLSLGWEFGIDRNVLGGPITVAGTTFRHGIGVHSRSSLTYDLKGAFETFTTYFGIDDDSGPYADVSVRILVDGRLRFQQAGVRRGTLHGPLRLDVARANRIELIVDFGKNGDIQDRFDWVEPALIR